MMMYKAIVGSMLTYGADVGKCQRKKIGKWTMWKWIT